MDTILTMTVMDDCRDCPFLFTAGMEYEFKNYCNVLEKQVGPFKMLRTSTSIRYVIPPPADCPLRKTDIVIQMTTRSPKQKPEEK